MMLRLLTSGLLISVSCPVILATLQRGPSTGSRVETLALSTDLDSHGRLGAVAVDRDGFIYVSNFADAVWKVSPDGDVDTIARGLPGPSGLAIDINGDLLVAGFFDHTIRRISSAGRISTFVDHGLAAPVGLAVDPAGNVFVCNCGNDTIARVTVGGDVGTFASGSLFACPNGIAMDDHGDLYVVNFNNDDVVRLSPEGTVSRLATLAPEGSGNAHIAFAAGSLFVTKIRAHEILRVSREGHVERFAGSGELGLRDGDALTATLARPNGIAVGPDGTTLWFNDLQGEWRGSRPTSIVLRNVRVGEAIPSVDTVRGTEPAAVHETLPEGSR